MIKVESLRRDEIAELKEVIRRQEDEINSWKQALSQVESEKLKQIKKEVVDDTR